MWTKEYKIDRYRQMNKTAKKGETVFAGSSLMEMFPIERFVQEDQLDRIVYNRGVGGYVTTDLLANIGPCILDLEPSKLFINIGTNDLSDPQRSIPEIMNTYGAILKKVKERLRGVKIYLMAYYPVNYDAATEAMKPCLLTRTNEKIECANEAVERLASQTGTHYININAPLLDECGRLNAGYTIEGLHINEAGYRAIYPLLMQYILQ